MAGKFRWVASQLVACLGPVTFADPAHAESGPVVVWFSGQPADVSDKIALLCADREATVIEQDDRHVLCQRTVSGGKGILAQALLGNSYSTAPQLNIRFSLLRDQGVVRVQASQWVELQMAGGQTRRTELNGTKNRSDLEGILMEKGGHNVPPGVLPSFPAVDGSTAAPLPPMQDEP